MKTLFLLTSLVLAQTAFADSWANALLANVGTGTNYSGVLFSENCEGWTNWSRPAGTPWTLTVNNGWVMDWTTTSNPGSVITNADTTGLSMEGSNCLHLVDGTGDYPLACSPAFAAQSECWVYLEWRAAALGATVLKSLSLLDGSSNRLAYVDIIGSGGTALYQGSQAASMSYFATNNITYSLYLHYLAGSGTNGVASLGISTNSIRPTSGPGYAEVTTGDATASAVRLQFSVGGAGNQYIDKIRIYSGSTPPTDNPD